MVTQRLKISFLANGMIFWKYVQLTCPRHGIRNIRIPYIYIFFSGCILLSFTNSGRLAVGTSGPLIVFSSDVAREVYEICFCFVSFKKMFLKTYHHSTQPSTKQSPFLFSPRNSSLPIISSTLSSFTIRFQNFYLSFSLLDVLRHILAQEDTYFITIILCFIYTHSPIFRNAFLFLLYSNLHLNSSILLHVLGSSTHYIHSHFSPFCYPVAK